MSSADFLRVRSRALRAASRARAAETALSMTMFAVRGCSSRYAREPLVDDGLDRALDLGVAELRLRLPFELRLAHLHRQHAGEAFADVVAGEREVRFLVGLLQEVPLLGVGVDRARQRRLEAGEVRAAFVRVDVVDEGEDVLVVAVVVLQRELDADAVALGLDVHDLGVQRLAAALRNCTISLRPPFAWKVSSFSLPSRSSVSVIVTPLLRNDSSRRRSRAWRSRTAAR